MYKILSKKTEIIMLIIKGIRTKITNIFSLMNDFLKNHYKVKGKHVFRLGVTSI